MAVGEHMDDAENQPERPQKRKFGASVLEHFTKLANGQEKVRVKSGVGLLRSLNEDGEKSEDELKYALGRLIRGLGASKIPTRTGFFAALVAVLNLKNVSVADVFQHVDKELNKASGGSKSEVADVSCGQILVGGAIIRSELYAKSDAEDKKKVLEVILKGGKERAYLAQAAFTFIIDLMMKIDVAEFKGIVFPLIKSEIGKPWQEQDLDSLLLLIEAKEKFPEVVTEKFLKGSLGTSDTVCPESLGDLCATIMTIPRATSLNHPVYEVVVKRLAKTPEHLPAFFSHLDHHLTRPNRNKYLAATQILSSILESPDCDRHDLIPDLITENMIRQTLGVFQAGRAREYQKPIAKLFDAIVTALKDERVKYKAKVKVIRKLLFHPGTFIFEKVTKSKLVQMITSTLDVKGVQKLAEIYADVVQKQNVGEQLWNNDRIYASHLLAKLLNHPAMKEQSEWKVAQLKFLMSAAFFRGGSEAGAELCEALRETFYSSLELKLDRLEQLRQVLSQLVRCFDENLGNLRRIMSAEEAEIWRKTVDLVAKLDGKKGRKQVFHTLFLHLGLQIFGKDSQLATESLKELFSCYERIKRKSNEEGDENDPLWIEVVVDLFLNLLSHGSHLLRNVIRCVFPHLCSHLNHTAMHQILTVLDPKHENPLSAQNEEEVDDEEEEEEDEDDESESDVSDEEDAEDEEAEDEDETVNDRLRMALHQALGAGSDAESVNLDDMNDSDAEKLDDALSAAFKQFRPNTGRNSKKQKKDDEALTHFRVRVLDLIEIYLGSNPAMHLTLEIMLPLLQTLEFSIRDDHQRPLLDRCRACLKKLTGLKKFEDVEGVDEELLVELLNSLLEKGTKNAVIIQDMGEQISECCVFIIACAQIVKNKHKKVARVIRSHLETFYMKRDCLTPYVLFKNVMGLNWKGITELVPTLMEFAFSETVRPFRRSQALELLRIFYTNQRFAKAHRDKVDGLPNEQFLTSSLKFFEEFEPKQVKEKFLCNLFALLAAVKAQNVEFEGWSRLGEAVRECRSLISFSKDTKVAFGKLCRSLNVSHLVQMKANVVKLGNEPEQDKDAHLNGDAAPKKGKKRKRQDKEGKKLKKECKELRLKSLSEGFESEKRKRRMENGDAEEGHKRRRLSDSRVKRGSEGWKTVMLKRDTRGGGCQIRRSF